MQNVVDQIRYDHISMSRILLLTEKELVKLKSEGTADFNLLLDCMRYMIEYADIAHHPKEDVMMDCIYGRLPELDKVIDEIKFQHGSIAEKSIAFAEIINAATVEQFVEKERIVALGQSYVSMQRKHIRLEEESLLRKLKTLLTDDDETEINEMYSKYLDPQLKDNFEKEYNSLYRALIGS